MFEFGIAALLELHLRIGFSYHYTEGFIYSGWYIIETTYIGFCSLYNLKRLMCKINVDIEKMGKYLNHV